jgi:hypothetical protein
VADTNRTIEYDEVMGAAATAVELGAGGLGAISGELKKSAVKCLGRDIGAVWPDDRAELGVDPNLSEKARISSLTLKR